MWAQVLHRVSHTLDGLWRKVFLDTLNVTLRGYMSYICGTYDMYMSHICLGHTTSEAHLKGRFSIPLGPDRRQPVRREAEGEGRRDRDRGRMSE